MFILKERFLWSFQLWSCTVGFTCSVSEVLNLLISHFLRTFQSYFWSPIRQFTLFIPPLLLFNPNCCLCCNVVSRSLSYRYYFAFCSLELAACEPPPLARSHSTRQVTTSHRYCGSVGNSKVGRCDVCFFPSTARLWNSLPNVLFDSHTLPLLLESGLLSYEDWSTIFLPSIAPIMTWVPVPVIEAKKKKREISEKYN